MPGLWHNKMESYFPKEMTEIKFLCCRNSKDTCRRADVLLNNNRTCEIQHSFISSEEIEKRCNDWNLFGKEIIWLVDGNTGIEYEELSSGNYLIIFKDDWKYKSFITTYNFILLEIDGKVFKIELKKIKCKMIELKMFITIETVVNILKSKPENIWDSWCDDNVIKCNLSIHQQGAGNGKTYGIWKSIAENIDKSTFILLTKQHSAKNVMYEELSDQTEREEYHIENLTEILEDHDKTHYVIKYIHKISKRECKVIIGTIDSFIYNLSGSSQCDNFFEGILQNIKLNGLTKVHNGSMNFASQYVTLNKQTELWIDEAQDLPNSYLDAMAKLMLNTNCDIHMVGDKLQTLQYEENCLTTIIRDEGLVNNINYIYHTPINVNRRIKVSGMRQEINNVINFNKYDLPEIDNENDGLGEPTIKCYEAKTIYKETDNKIIDKYVTNIIDRVDYEVKLNHYTPENFMFIFPIMKDNEVASELHTKLTEYWIQKFNDEEYNKNIKNTYWKNYRHNQYTQYVYLHKHTEGTCINTKDSVNASRIMSIRTSKGDGREVVFILQLTEGRLKLCSNKKYGLVYESHLHVALTRAKHTNYIALEENNDKIHKLFSNCGYVGYFPEINSTIRLNRIIDNIDKQKIIELMETHITQPDFTLNKQNETEENIDWGYHCIKRGVYYFKFILGIVNKRYDNIDFEQSELAIILSKLSRIKIEVMSPSEFYYFLNKNGYNDLTVFPLCNLSDNFNYKGYFIKIKDAMKKIQKCIIGNELDLLDVYETVILIYMITLYKNKKYCDISPVEIYNITDFFKTNSKECKLLNTIDCKIYDKINDLLDEVEVKSKWNIQKHMKLKSTSNNFTICNNNFDLIGYDSKNITHIILSSDLNQLNFWDTMITALLERFLIYNPNHDEDCE